MNNNQDQQVSLCIQERYYATGMFRLETFQNMKELETYRMKLNQGTLTWLLGEAMPKRRAA